MIQPRLAVILPLGAILVLAGLRDSSATRQKQADRNRQMSHDAETRGLAEPFKGITTDGRIVPDLFAIRSTGVRQRADQTHRGLARLPTGPFHPPRQCMKRPLTLSRDSLAWRGLIGDRLS